MKASVSPSLRVYGGIEASEVEVLLDMWQFPQGPGSVRAVSSLHTDSTTFIFTQHSPSCPSQNDHDYDN